MFDPSTSVKVGGNQDILSGSRGVGSPYANRIDNLSDNRGVRRFDEESLLLQAVGDDCLMKGDAFPAVFAWAGKPFSPVSPLPLIVGEDFEDDDFAMILERQK